MCVRVCKCSMDKTFRRERRPGTCLQEVLAPKWMGRERVTCSSARRLAISCERLQCDKVQWQGSEQEEMATKPINRQGVSRLAERERERGPMWEWYYYFIMIPIIISVNIYRNRFVAGEPAQLARSFACLHTDCILTHCGSLGLLIRINSHTEADSSRA